MTRGPLARVAAALGAGAVALGLALAVSTRVGGPLSFVVTHGSSMEPGISAGTLVVLRDAGATEVGDVVAYRDPQLGQVVLHRVVALDAGRLVLRGDNNSWLDAYRPRPDELLGERLWQLRGAVPALQRATRPTVAGPAAAALALLLLAGSRTRPSRRRSGTRRALARTALSTEERMDADRSQDVAPDDVAWADAPEGDVWWDEVWTDPDGAPWYLHDGTWYGHDGIPWPGRAHDAAAAEETRDGPRDRGAARAADVPGRRPATALAQRVPSARSALPTPLARGAAAGAAASLVLGVWALAGPVRVDAPGTAEATWRTTFSYSADAARGAAYPDGTVRTGQPVFTRVVPAVDVTAELSLDLPAGVAAQGTWRLVTEVSDDSGWRRTAATSASQPLGDSGGSLRTRLEPAALLALADAAQRETGAAASRRTVVVRAVTDVRFSSPAGATEAAAAPELVLDLDETTLRPRDAAPAATGAAADQTAAPASGSGLVPVVTQKARRLGAGVVSVDAGTARPLAALGLVGAAALLLVARRRDAGGGEQAREAATVARAGDLVVPVSATRSDPHLAVVEVASLEALLGLARRYERVVLQETVDGRARYSLVDDGLLYRWPPHRPADAGSPTTAPSTSPAAALASGTAPATSADAAPALAIPSPRASTEDLHRSPR